MSHHFLKFIVESRYIQVYFGKKKNQCTSISINGPIHFLVLNFNNLGAYRENMFLKFMNT